MYITSLLLRNKWEVQQRIRKDLLYLPQLSHIEYPTTKLVGIAEMKSRSIDITCSVKYCTLLTQTRI